MNLDQNTIIGIVIGAVLTYIMPKSLYVSIVVAPSDLPLTKIEGDWIDA